MAIFWTLAALIAIPIATAILKYRRIINIVIKTFSRDIKGLYMYFAKVSAFVLYCKYTNKTMSTYFDKVVKRHPNKPCFYFEDEVWAYEKVQKESLKIANYFQSLGYKRGDSIGLCMENRPEYVCIWLGLSRIGVVTSLLNYNVRLQSLEHCISAANCSALIFGTELTSAIQEIVDYGGLKEIKLFSMEDRSAPPSRLSVNHTNLSKELETVQPVMPLLTGNNVVKSTDVILNIYTSGTTGLPKAVIMTNSRMFTYSGVGIVALDPQKDILLTPIPLYHVQGGVVGVTSAIILGVPQVILRKFSASKFWNECIKYNATAVQYLGEIIRYLHNQPPKSVDNEHKVKKFLGNGVNPEIWASFVKRFNNVKILEMYGSTEGNCSFMNTEGHVGAIGYIPILGYPFLPIYIGKVDVVTGEIIRDPKTGLVAHVELEEVGELMSEVKQGNPMREFNGYTDKSATEKKIVHGVKKKGDKWFRTGDFVNRDELGYIHFKDRNGDTFKWKGENVSTMEVEGVMIKSAEMRGTTVYGVTIPGTEGRCGMATIYDTDGNLDLGKVASAVNKHLPSYARPLFIRVSRSEMQMTGTFKPQKLTLQQEGFNIDVIQDPIFFLKDGNYIALDSTLYKNILEGNIRF